MVKQSKMTTVSVRIEDELMKRFDAITNMGPINKSDFLRACVEKFCGDNQILIDHSGRVAEYVAFVRNEISRLPSDMIIVRNGSWKEVKESTMLILCDEMWMSLEQVFSSWLEFIEGYNVRPASGITTFSEAEESEGLLDLGDIALLLAEKSGTVERTDIRSLVDKEDWITDSLEISRISLSYACKKAIEENSAVSLIKEYLRKETEKKEEEPQRLVIDARGTFRRSGAILYMPVYTEEIQKVQ